MTRRPLRYGAASDRKRTYPETRTVSLLEQCATVAMGQGVLFIPQRPRARYRPAKIRCEGVSDRRAREFLIPYTEGT